MRVYSRQKINKMRRLRRSGFGINQIVASMSVPKTSVWHHIHDITLSGSQKAILRSNQGGSRMRKVENIRYAEEVAATLLKSKDREFIAMVAMLYWAEGHKSDRCEFTNTDGRMIAFYLKILRKRFKIKNQQIKITLRIFTGMKDVECLKYWSSIANVPSEDIKVRMNDGGSSGRTRYGVCRVTIVKSQSTLKLMHALINQISQSVLGY